MQDSAMEKDALSQQLGTGCLCKRK